MLTLVPIARDPGAIRTSAPLAMLLSEALAEKLSLTFEMIVDISAEFTELFTSLSVGITVPHEQIKIRIFNLKRSSPEHPFDS